MTRLEKFSFGIGDRFCLQAKAQLHALIDLKQLGPDVVPVWNKSNREHLIVGSEPASTRKAADEAVASLGWDGSYYCDADHIRLDTVDRFVPYCDFFTIDVADSIGVTAQPEEVKAFIESQPKLKVVELNDYLKTVKNLGWAISAEEAAERWKGQVSEKERTVALYLPAIREASRIYRKIRELRGGDNFITEVSMDETDRPQGGLGFLIILLGLADEGVPVQTIAPKFSGRFNKGVDFVGSIGRFEDELCQYLAAIEMVTTATTHHLDLPENLKLSIHSGSDKFSLYPMLHRVLKETGAGIHVKTAGTTWLEEVIGLAESGGEGLALAKEVYEGAFEHREELCAPYAEVIDIEPLLLPAPSEVRAWTPEQFVRAVRHSSSDPMYNSSMRQLLHVGYKIAAKMGPRYLEQVMACEDSISRNVRENLFERHLKPIFCGLE